MILLTASWRDFWRVWQVQGVTFTRDAWDPIDLLLQLIFAPVRIKALDGERLIGYVFGERRQPEGVGWITALGVHPDARRRGVGRRLLQAAEARLAMPRVCLTVRPSNQTAIHLYAQLGYQQTRRIPRYYPGGEDGQQMDKILAASPSAEPS